MDNQVEETKEQRAKRLRDERNKRYREKNKDAINLRRKMSPTIKEKDAEYSRKYRANNAERIKQKTQTSEFKEKNKQKSAKFRKRNPDLIKNNKRKALLLKKYNITLEEYDSLLLKQDHKCAICSSDMAQSNKQYLCVDHCHTTGKVRGLLCDKCNMGLGLFQDNIELLQNSITYLLNNIKNGE